MISSTPPAIRSGPSVKQRLSRVETGSAGDRLTATFAVGELVAGTYEIRGVLGGGGMGVVYDAVDVVLARRVAIKVSRYEAHAEALLAEARNLAALRGPAFPAVHAFGRHRGVDFVVMERLSGDTLDRRLADLASRGELMSVSDALEILLPLVEALAAAHDAGLAQRDLKPSNVMLTGDRVVLLDMGIAVPEALVRPGERPAGSILYMSPEVLLGRVRRGEGPLVDLYALGVVAHEILTGRTPFHADSVNDTVSNHLLAPIPDVRALRPDVPAGLAELIADLLAKEPSARPPSAEAVLWQLESLWTRSERTWGRGLNVLTVDDDPGVGRALKRALEAVFPRVSVDVLTDPELAMIDDGGTTPDIVLVDLNMPGHNGVEVCMSLLARPPSRRPFVVAMSAEASEQDVAVLHSIGVQEFVPKGEGFIPAMSAIVGRARASLAPPSLPAVSLPASIRPR